MSPTSQSKSLTSKSDALLTELIDEVSARLEAGESVDLDAFIAAHPERAEVLRKVLPALAVLADLGRSAAGGRDDGLAPPQPDAESLGELGDYRILREIGRGGMGVVYEATQLSLNRRVALKVLPFAGALDAHHLARFRLEAQAAAQLHHTNIVPVFAVGTERGVHYYAMQFIEGKTLAALIRELREQSGLPARSVTGPADDGATASTLAVDLISGRFGPTEAPSVWRGSHDPADPQDRKSPPSSPAPAEPGDLRSAPWRGRETRAKQTSSKPDASPTRDRAFFRTVANLGLQAAEALDHAHRLGILHRDIKPANLLLDVHGNLWVTDFGLARFGDDASLTMTGDLLGTLRYMSPEQALGHPAVIDQRSDIYGLGVTLYELLTQRPALDGRDRQTILRQIAQEEPPSPHKVDPAIPADLETIVLKSMAKERAARYATAQELAEDLRRFLKHEPIRARRPTLWDRAVKWQRRHPSVLPSAAVFLILVVAGLAISTALIAREQAVTHQALEVAETNEVRAQARRAHAEAILLKALDAMNQLLLTADPDDPTRKFTMTKRQETLAEQALRFYGAVLEQIRGDPDAQLEEGHVHLYTANVYSQRREIAKVMESYRNAIESYSMRIAEDPEDANAWDQLAQGHFIFGLTLLVFGREREAAESFPEAANAYEQAFHLAPNDSKALNYLAWFLATCPDLRFRNPIRAMTLSRQALAFKPHSRGIWNTLGVASYRAGRWDETVMALNRAMELSKGGDGNDWFFLSMVQARKGELELASQWYNKAADWMDSHNTLDGALRGFRAEAAALLGQNYDLAILKPS